MRLLAISEFIVRPVPRDVAGGVAALFSGIALVICILTGVSLRVLLVLTAALAAGVIRLLWRNITDDGKQRLTSIAWTGVISGSVATVAYDAARSILSLWDPSPYDPFEAMRRFGILLSGSAASPEAVFATGAAFHIVNGVSFAIAYCFFVRHPRVSTAVLWAMVLETAQLILYPGWLKVQFYREFAQISAASHLVYGATLGGCARYLDRGTSHEEGHPGPLA